MSPNPWVSICLEFDKTNFPDAPITHSFLSGRAANGTSGTVCIPADTLQHFYQVYAKQSKSKLAHAVIFAEKTTMANRLSVSEVCKDKDNHILLFDIDMKVKVELNTHNVEVDAMRFQTLFQFVYNTIVHDFLNSDDTLFIVGCAYSYKCKNDLHKIWYTIDPAHPEYMKIGFHFFFPKIFVNSATQLFLRKFLINALCHDTRFYDNDKACIFLTKDLQLSLGEGGWYTAVDVAIAKSPKCRLFGCCKIRFSQKDKSYSNDQRIYEVCYCHDNHNYFNPMDLIRYNQDLYSLLQLVSLQRTHDDPTSVITSHDIFPYDIYDDNPIFTQEALSGNNDKCKLHTSLETDRRKRYALQRIARILYPSSIISFMGPSKSERECRKTKEKTEGENDAVDDANDDDDEKVQKVVGYRIDIRNLFCINKGRSHKGCIGGYIWVSKQKATLYCRCQHDNYETDTGVFDRTCPKFAIPYMLNAQTRVILFGQSSLDQPQQIFTTGTSAERRTITNMLSVFS